MNALIQLPGAGLALCLTMLARPVHAQQVQDRRYTKIAPLEQYLMPRDSEVALARSAAPERIARDAEVVVLGRRGYETAVGGSNGWVCIVDRGWTSDFDDPEFMNPTLREPMCFNPPAARTILPRAYKKTALALAGLDKTQMFDSVRVAYARHELPAPEPGAMCYMLSSRAFFGPRYGRGGPHLMFYFSRTDPQLWGAGVPGSPVIVHQDSPEPITTFVVLVPKYSDGTPRPPDDDSPPKVAPVPRD